MKYSVRDDPRTLPAYALSEAAHYVRVPLATLRSWVAGRPYPTARGERKAPPIIEVPTESPIMLSFVNLVEAHVLAAITRRYRIPLQKARAAVRFLQKEFGSPHPLAEQAMETDMRDLFIRKADLLINITREGQTALDQMLDAYLRRIERDPRGLAIRLYPFTRASDAEGPRIVVIDPRISFGKPILAGTSIPTAVVAERYKAGESIVELQEDYGTTAEAIEEAIRCELEITAA